MDKQYDHLSAEKSARELWQSQKTYSLENNPGQLYSVDTPPPTVSGSLHIGHIFSYTQTDIIARYKRMQGHAVFYPFGFDDNGLPTERFVEKKHNIVAHAMARSEFIKLCMQETAVAEKQFEDLWRRMGLSVDWDACYSTISDSTRKISQESFIRLYQKGYIYRKDEPALYCTTCRTSVSQAELDDKESNSFFNDIVFKDSDGNDLIIGTTRLELLPSCVAVFYNPADLRYTHLKGKQALVPIYNLTVPLIADEAVAIEKGTGLVMCCTFGDKADIAWIKKYNLPIRTSIGLDGKWKPDTGPLAGLRVHAAREKILELFKEQGLLKQQKPIVHSVNVHERCKKEIEYLALPQWFLSILPFKKTFIELADRIAWYPSFMKSRYENWVENLSWDWGLSRQRFYGIPFPAWHCTKCNEILLASLDQLPVDPQETPYPGKHCPKCNSTDIVPDTDVMDTWNTSSLTPYIVQQLYERNNQSPFAQTPSPFLPMSMRPQAHDIIRTWAFDTIVKTWLHHETIPWQNIVISGHVLSTGGDKLSKSKENAQLAPEQLLEQYSADVIRYWTASGSLGHDVPFSANQLKIGQRLVTKIWNAFRFMHEHPLTSDAIPTHASFTSDNPNDHNLLLKEELQLGMLNEWILDRISNCADLYHKKFATYEFGHALDHIEQFFWQDFCDNYLELIKDQLFNPQNYDAAQVQATLWTLHHVGLRILQLYAPYLPYITETLYQQLFKGSRMLGAQAASIHQTKFAAVQTTFMFPESSQTIQTTIQAISTIRKLKSEKQLSLKTDVATLTIYAPDELRLSALTSQQQLIKGITRAQTIEFVSGSATANLLEQRDNAWHAIITVV